jgi:hypothetical protein
VRKRPRKYCADWGCPAKWACARHHCRSLDYWRFDIEASAREGVGFMKQRREPGADSCNRFEDDEPREWLADIATIPVDGTLGGYGWIAP